MIIYKKDSYKEHKCNIGIDDLRTKEFNEGKEIKVTIEEFQQIANLRFIGIKEVKDDSLSESAGKTAKSGTAAKIKGH